MKFANLLIAAAALATGGAAWSDTPGAGPAQRQAREQQDAARYRVCDAQRAENPATHTIDFTAEGRRCLIGALDQAASVQGTLVLLRNASVALLKTPDDPPLRTAALGAVSRARGQLVQEMPALPEVFAQQAAALDMAEYAIHLPRLHHEQQIWRLEAYEAQATLERIELAAHRP